MPSPFCLAAVAARHIRALYASAAPSVKRLRTLAVPLTALAATGGLCVPGAALPGPTAVEAAARADRVRVFWDPVPGAAGYRVYRDGAPIAEAPASAREMDDTSAEPGRTYVYNVGTLDGSGVVALGAPYAERAYPPLPDESRCDVLVVGATTGGVAAATAAARYGLRVTLIEETRRIGGMSVNGLGATDLRRVAHSSGFFEEFRKRIIALYGGGDGLRYEPRIAQQAMKQIVWSAPGLTLHREVRPVGVQLEAGRIVAVRAEEMTSGRRVVFRPRIVIDSTECGDVAAWAGAPFRVGREPRSARERHAGYILYDRAHDALLPGSTGKGDRRLQAYAYLMVVKDYGPGEDRTIPRPPGYDPANYDHAPEWQKTWAVSSGKLPNGKFEINQHPDGSDLQVVNYGYPNADYAERRRIEKLYRDHALGYLYYLQTVEGQRGLGLSEDDYRDSGDWPMSLYVREARRFDAGVWMDETDIATARDLVRPGAIGIGDYAMDSHATQPKTDWSTPDMGEGEFYLPQYTPWHQVPLAIMMPLRVDNLLVPTAVSATHVAYGTYRLEPVRMHFGAAAGVAAWLSLRYALLPRDVPARQVQAELLKHRCGREGDPARDGIGAPGPTAEPTLLYVFDGLPRDALRFREVQWLGARGFFPSPAPETRSASSGMLAAPFGPDEPATQADGVDWLNLIASRAGAPASKLPDPEEPTSVLTRGDAAALVVRFTGWRAAPGSSHYADVPAGSPLHDAVEALHAQWIDSRLWDGPGAFAPDGLLTFGPERPLTRAELAQIVYLVHVHYGPLFFDHPSDRPIDVRVRRATLP